jgi:2-polyprenyl-3-methyl-5-hydroxy-6-metoxy-1,4-benzoquinol methylase
MLEHRAETKNILSYQGARPDILQFVNDARFVLDVGCNIGALARELKRKFPKCAIWGIEINPSALKQAAPILQAGFCVNLDHHERLQDALGDLRFDTIIAGDVLEHTSDPWRIVETLFSRLLPGGSIYVSLPNIAHWKLIWHWLRQSWPMDTRGIFDNTHLRFFMRRDLEKLAPPGSTFELLHRTFRLFDKEHPRLDRISSRVLRRIVWLREYFVFQYVFAIRKPRDNG